ncbi:MAG: ribosomal-processing cysteine protease Prp [Eubacterium sp.]|nr:ribosomal-processing cysteine protease Prp [Eubacterium sp.]MDD7210169.1 ribosomal-processing cysteine protease Prp [Lachnospiraceae bacterium]MDY5497440.1 ribosomal-processing cysteine protease Prp [Anaerobutyricum sp.]
MVKITIYKKPEGQFKGFQVIGHADSVEEGADLVCCSVSVLTINLVNSLEAFTDDVFEVTQQDALGLIQVTFKNPLSEKALLLMNSYVLGIRSIEEEYDLWLKVITREV